VNGVVSGGRRLHGAFDPRGFALALSAGVLLMLALPELPPVEIHLALLASVLVPWRGRRLWAAFVLGAVWTGWHGQSYLDQRWPSTRHGEEIELVGVIASLPERQPMGDGTATWRFELEPAEDIGPRRLRVSWYRSDAVLRGGQCWRLRLRLRTPHGSLNPGGFDYEAWLLRERIGATATVRDGVPCEAAPGHRVLRLRQHIAGRIDAVLGDGVAAALTRALVLGDASGLRDADWERLRRTGTTHLIVISGFHLSIVSGFAFLLLRWLWSSWPRACLYVPAQRVGLYGSAIVACGYAALSGLGTPVLRALIMLLVLVAAAAAGRLNQPGRALACAWVLILLVDPFAVLSPGLWLSFGAVAAIFYATAGRRHPPSAWRLLVVLQLLLSLISIPLTLYFFQGLTWLAPVANLVAVPLFSVLTPLMLLAVLTALLSDGIGARILQIAGELLRWVDRGLDWAAAAPQAWLPASAAPAALALALIGVVLAFAPRGLPLRPLALLCLIPLLWPRPPTVDGLTVTALDVGQGLAVVVRTPRHTLLYDAGPAFEEGFDAGRSIVVPYLLAQGVRRIDRLVLSHDHNDHAGGIAAVRSLLQVDDEIGTVHGRPCIEGERWYWDGVRFSLLHPQSDRGSDNEQSCVLRIDGAYSVLLPGDIERRSEARLLRDRSTELAADVLLSPHHGSRTSSSAELVAAVRPHIVVHSAGWRSRFGHPRAEVVERYAAVGAEQFVTGVVGAVTIREDRDGRLRVLQYRRENARWWNAAAEP